MVLMYFQREVQTAQNSGGLFKLLTYSCFTVTLKKKRKKKGSISHAQLFILFPICLQTLLKINLFMYIYNPTIVEQMTENTGN